jgi:hypothetical protein
MRGGFENGEISDLILSVFCDCGFGWAICSVGEAGQAGVGKILGSERGGRRCLDGDGRRRWGEMGRAIRRVEVAGFLMATMVLERIDGRLGGFF